MIQEQILTAKFTFILLLVVIAFSGCKIKEDRLTLATYTYSKNRRINNLKPLSNDLEKILKRPVSIKSYPDVLSFVEGIKSNEVDIAFINTLGYSLLSIEKNNMLPIAALKVREDVVDNYKTVLLTNTKSISDLNSLKDNSKNLSITFVTEGSTSGNLVPRLFLGSIGIKSPELQFKSVAYGGNHKMTLAKLLDGKTHICAIGSNQYYEHLRENPENLQSISVLWMSEEIPLGPVLINNEISDSDRKRITNLLLNLHQTNPEALRSIKQGWSEARQAEKFYPITDRYYDDFKEIHGKRTNLLEILNSFVKS